MNTLNPSSDNTIEFALGHSSLGEVLLAMSPHGVCAIALGDHADSLINAFKHKHPDAQLQADKPLLQQHLATVIAFIESPQQDLDLPLDVRGTIFQQQVWQALKTIPLGTTASYTVIAKRIDQPSAVRAVAAACAANPLALVIPCHRVITSDGNLSGYRWGVARKAELLRREAQAVVSDADNSHTIAD